MLQLEPLNWKSDRASFVITSVFIIFGARRMKLALLSVNFNVFSARHLFKAPRSVFLVLVSFSLLFNAAKASAQSSGKPLATKVTVAKVKTDTISEFSELQGRLVAGAIEAVTAVTTSKIEILDRN